MSKESRQVPAGGGKVCPRHPDAATTVSVRYLDGDLTRRCGRCRELARPARVPGGDPALDSSREGPTLGGSATRKRARGAKP